MYIPSQEERYGKVAPLTLLLCVMVPPALVVWWHSEMGLWDVLGAFTWPIAYPIVWVSGNLPLGLVISALLQLGGVLLLKRCSWSAKRKMTFAILWGMLFALIVRLIMVAELKAAVINQMLSE